MLYDKQLFVFKKKKKKSFDQIIRTPNSTFESKAINEMKKKKRKEKKKRKKSNIEDKKGIKKPYLWL